MPALFKVFIFAMFVIAFGAYASHADASINWGMIGIIFMFLVIMLGFHIVLSGQSIIMKNQHKIMQRLNEMDDK